MPSLSPDLLLLNPGPPPGAYQSLGRELAAVEPPIWAGLIAAFARKKGLSVEILDANAEGLGPAEAAARVAARAPVLAAVVVYGHNPSASTQVMPAASAFCSALRGAAPGLPVLLLGGHAAALPERTLAEEQAGFVCGGEGPHTVVRLVEELKSGAPDFARVPDLWRREGGAIKSTPPAPLVTDLDAEMPGIAWDLLPMDRYRAHNWHCFGHPSRQPYAALYTTLGCPYHCSFCCIHAPFLRGAKAAPPGAPSGRYRLWSPAAVLAQIDVLAQRHGVRHIKFADELFVLNPSHVNGVCDGLIQRGYGLNIWAYARVDTLRPGMAPRLKQAGVNWLAFGIEAASERVLKDARKGYAQSDLRRVLAEVRDAGISVIANFIFGLPEDDLATMRETLDLAVDLNCEFVNFNCAMAYPGSDLYAAALKEGWPLPKTWGGYSQYSADSTPLPTRHVSGAEVLRFRDEAFNTYFSGARYLEMIRRKFGEETVDAIRRMTSHKLVRHRA